MFRCGGNHSGYQSPSSWLPISRATSRSSACMKKAPQLSRSTGATGKYRFPKNLTGEIQLACWFVISCCIMFICYFKIIYIYIYYYIYICMYLNVVDWYSILGRHCRSSLAGQTRLRWKMSFQHVSKSFPVCPVSPLSLACGGHVVAGSPTGKMILLSVGQEVCWSMICLFDFPTAARRLEGSQPVLWS